MSYRAYNENDKSDYKKQMRALRDQWHITTAADEKARQQREEFNALFN